MRKRKSSNVYFLVKRLTQTIESIKKKVLVFQINLYSEAASSRVARANGALIEWGCAARCDATTGN